MVQTIVIHGCCDDDDLEFIKKEVRRLNITAEEILDVIVATHQGLADGSITPLGIDDRLKQEVQEVFTALNKGSLWPHFERMCNPEIVARPLPCETISLEAVRKAKERLGRKL